MKYNKSTNTIGSIPCHTSCRDLWEDGKEYEKEHYLTGYQYFDSHTQEWFDCMETAFQYMPYSMRRIIAVPLPQPAQNVDAELPILFMEFVTNQCHWCDEGYVYKNNLYNSRQLFDLWINNIYEK